MTNKFISMVDGIRIRVASVMHRCCHRSDSVSIVSGQSLLPILLLCLTLFIGVGNVWGTETLDADFQCNCSEAGTSPDLFTASNGTAGSGYYQLKPGSSIVSKKSYDVDPSQSISITMYLGTFGGYESGKNDVSFYLVDKDGKQVSSKYTSNFTAKYTTDGGKSFSGTVTLNDGEDGKGVYFKFVPVATSGSKYARFHTLSITYTVGATTFSVTYNGNGNTGGSVPTDNTAYNNGATVTVKDNTGSLVKTNYAFGGWNTNAEGTGTDRAVGSTFSISANTTLYAKWIPTYTVTYNGNGNTSGSVPTDATKYQTGTTVTVKDNTGSLAKSGWTFAGWNKNNTGTSTNYDAGSGTFSISANTTLYAKWTRTVTWSVNGLTNVYPASTVTYNATASKVASIPTAPNPASYCGDKFVGWTTDAEYVHGTSPLFTTAAGSPDLNSITTAVTFYAVFADYAQ